VDKLSIPAKYITGNCEKETDKTYMNVDAKAILLNIESGLEDGKVSVKDILNAQLEYCGYVDYVDNRVKSNIWFVREVKLFSNKAKPKVTLYNLKEGRSEYFKMGNNTIFLEKPFKAGNLIVINSFKKQPKTKMVDGKWVKSEDEFELVMTDYNVY
jgi:hypothetical protein